MKKSFGKYYLGLDMGTSSIGWAVTDLNYNVLNFNNKAMWGIRLFDEANTAEERRTFRSARRRNMRETQRIKLLQELFAEEMAKKDFGFFMRLSDSKYYEEDKQVKQPNTLFNDHDFNDSNYAEKYPTIYHLRKELTESTKEHDIRLVYLAIHHTLKHRGHFLYAGEFSDVSELDVKELVDVFCYEINQAFDLEISCNDIETVKKVLANDSMNITNKKKVLSGVFSYDKTFEKQMKAIVSLLAGGKTSLADIFSDDSLKDAEQKAICLSDGSFDENESTYAAELGDEISIIEAAKAVFDWGILQCVLDGEKNISAAKVKLYEEHQQDLKMLKAAVKEYCPEKYKAIFGEQDGKKTANYSAYIGRYKNKGKNYVIEKSCSQEEFCKELKKVFSKVSIDEKKYPYLLSKIENATLLPKQKTKDNSVIPYQVHEKELKAILKNASNYLDFLNEKDAAGMTTSEKILSIMEYRIPYYVGPINGAHKKENNKGFYWAEKKSDEPVRPWNFEEVIDLEASAEKFIRRMTNKCTYVVGADVLPKNSLLYSEFAVLNELNNMTIDGDKPSVEIKQRIYNDLFLSYNKVTQKKIKLWLSQNGFGADCQLAGIDGDFKNSMTSYLDFKHILGKDIFSDDETGMVEDIIKFIVLFGDDKKILERKIKNLYGNKLSEAQISEIKKKKYTGWGRLSREFLTEIEDLNTDTGELCSIIFMMRNHPNNPNLMQLLGNEFGFTKALNEYNSASEKTDKNITYSAVEELYVSPSVKRSIWQTINIVKELRKITGHDPKKIFIEMARGPEESQKGRTTSRKAQLLSLYETCKTEYGQLYAALNAEEEGRLRNDRLYLYYAQFGKSMYTGQAIDIERLFVDYDIDHIYPQSKIMDDSLSNRVLVERTENAKKGDAYPLKSDIQEKMKPFWSMLKNKDLITTSKYDRLTRKTELTNEELGGFVARQIVETRQSTKAVAKLLNEMCTDSKIVYVKAGNVSRFRQGEDDFAKGRNKAEIEQRKKDNQFIKVREINDYHHAKDAYLNIVVGNVFDTKFGNPTNYFSKAQVEPYSLNAMYKFPLKDKDGVVWEPTTEEAEGTMEVVKKNMRRNNILFTRYAKENKGGFYDQMLMKKGKGQACIKEADKRLSIEKYGGFNKVAGAYFFLVEYEKKGKLMRTIEFVPVLKAKDLAEKRYSLEDYCKKELQIPKAKILISKIKIDTLFCTSGFKMHLSSRSEDRLKFKNGNQLLLSEKTNYLIKKVIKISLRDENAVESELKGVEDTNLLEIYDCLLDKLENTVYNVRLGAQIENMRTGREMFNKLSKYNQCKIIVELLHTFQCNSTKSDLSLLQKGKSTGEIKFSKIISKLDNIYIINQSVTGLFERKIDLLKI